MQDKAAVAEHDALIRAKLDSVKALLPGVREIIKAAGLDCFISYDTGSICLTPYSRTAQRQLRRLLPAIRQLGIDDVWVEEPYKALKLK